MRARLVSIAVAASLALVWAASAGGAATSTHASVYSPFRPGIHVVKTIRGSCWEGSAAVAHRRAWRCMSKNLIYDPCFSTSNTSHSVRCPTQGPWLPQVIRIKLSKRLPIALGNRRRASTTGLPWALETANGWRCRLATGATSVLDGQRLNYFCSGTQQGLWGAPNRTSEPWTIFVAPAQAHKLNHTIAISSAWF